MRTAVGYIGLWPRVAKQKSRWLKAWWKNWFSTSGRIHGLVAQMAEPLMSSSRQEKGECCLDGLTPTFDYLVVEWLWQLRRDFACQPLQYAEDVMKIRIWNHITKTTESKFSQRLPEKIKARKVNVWNILRDLADIRANKKRNKDSASWRWSCASAKEYKFFLFVRHVS